MKMLKISVLALQSMFKHIQQSHIFINVRLLTNLF